MAHMLDATLLKGWGGVGMLTFLVSGTHVGCYVTEGLGWGGAC